MPPTIASKSSPKTQSQDLAKALQTDSPAYPLPVRLYNTLTQKTELLDPVESGKISMYVCGPTVYDAAHLGHARCYITWDVLVRVLRFCGYQVTYVRNVTDVDDKILNRAQASNKPFIQVAEENLTGFRRDMAALNVLPPTHEPRATHHIPQMVAMVKQLLESGFAYATQDGSVYFRTRKFPHYGILSKKPLDDLRSGARVAVDQDKEDPLDFALWKGVEKDPKEQDEATYLATSWAGPCTTKGFMGFGKKEMRGRPGWHIECSAMIREVLGEQIDIHAGGADLVFPHHENELAQSVACCAQHHHGQVPGANAFVKTWLHNGFVNVNGEKMSKSLGNFTTIGGLMAMYDANTIRCFLLTNHYRMPVDFAEEALKAAKTNMGKLARTLGTAVEFLGMASEAMDTLVYPSAQAALEEEFQPVMDLTLQPLLDGLTYDVNTAQALAFINQHRSRLNTLLSQARPNPTEDNAAVKHCLRLLLTALNILGFDAAALVALKADLPEGAAEKVLTLYISINTELNTEAAMLTDPAEALIELVNLRIQAKTEKNWALADRIRNSLTDCGVRLLDRKGGGTDWEYHNENPRD